MKRFTAVTLIIMVIVLVLVGCNNNTGTAPRAKEDPRDAVIKNAIKKATSTSNPLELMALFAGHPETRGLENAGIADKMMMTALIIGAINGYDLDLSKAKDIKLKASKFSSAKRYCLDGTFNYSGSGRTAAGKIEIMDGTGTIFACTSPGKDGQPYLHKLEFALDGKTLSAAKKIAKTGGK